jgi:hypothetical protein
VCLSVHGAIDHTLTVYCSPGLREPLHDRVTLPRGPHARARGNGDDVCPDMLAYAMPPHPVPSPHPLQQKLQCIVMTTYSEGTTLAYSPHLQPCPNIKPS